MKTKIKTSGLLIKGALILGLGMTLTSCGIVSSILNELGGNNEPDENLVDYPAIESNADHGAYATLYEHLKNFQDKVDLEVAQDLSAGYYTDALEVINPYLITFQQNESLTAEKQPEAAQEDTKVTSKPNKYSLSLSKAIKPNQLPQTNDEYFQTTKDFHPLLEKIYGKSIEEVLARVLQTREADLLQKKAKDGLNPRFAYHHFSDKTKDVVPINATGEVNPSAGTETNSFTVSMRMKEDNPGLEIPLMMDYITNSIEFDDTYFEDYTYAMSQSFISNNPKFSHEVLTQDKYMAKYNHERLSATIAKITAEDNSFDFSEIEMLIRKWIASGPSEVKAVEEELIAGAKKFFESGETMDIFNPDSRFVYEADNFMFEAQNVVYYEAIFTFMMDDVE